MLFSEIVYGPIHSRRLGLSLGMEVMPLEHKLCTFDCIYCECGFNEPVDHPVLPTVDQIHTALETKLRILRNQDIQPDVITFSGNGEPTLHPDFLAIIKDTCCLRDEYCPKAKVSVLSNSTQLFRPTVVEALKLADNRILKLDSAIDATMRLIDQPVNQQLTVHQIVQWLSQFNGDFTLQTCFLRGTYRGQTIDNTTPDELDAWYRIIDYLHPKQVMIYVIDRATPVQTLQKIPACEMQAIAEPVRRRMIDISVSV